jgi:hypothetical protein
VNTATILDLITAREATAIVVADLLREQITALTGELATVEAELADLQITRQTLMKLTHGELTATDPTITSAPYQQILAVFDPTGPGMRAKDVCRALGTDVTPRTPKASAPNSNAWSTARSSPRPNPAYSALPRNDVSSRTAL